MDPLAHSPVLSRRNLLAGGVALGAVPFLPRFFGTANALPASPTSPDAPAAFGFPEPDMTSRIVRPIEFPVDGTVSWTDTYGACRDGCSRRHEGQDLLGHKLEKLVACVDGTVVGFQYDTGGNYLYLQDAEGWNYGYLHINNDTPGTDDGLNPRQWAFAPGIDVGSRVRKGQHIAYMGDSGNAEATTPHCHFEIRKPADRWYHGQAINAKYSLDAASHGGPTTVPTTKFLPWSTAAGFLGQQYVDFLGRNATTSESATWVPQLETGAKAPADLVEWLLQQPGSGDVVAPLIRMYLGFFNRLPNATALRHWVGRLRAGDSLDAIANTFGATAEFNRGVGSVDDSRYVTALYRDLLGIVPDAARHDYWTQKLATGSTRSAVMRFFLETEHYKIVSYDEVRVCLVYAAMLLRPPDTGALFYWIDRIKRGTPLQTLIATVLSSAHYRGRFPAAR